MSNVPFSGFFIFIMIFIVAIFLFSIIAAVFTFTTIAKMAKRNAKSPQISVPATVIAKRTQFHHSHDMGSTTYHATFEVESGDRMELYMSGEDYGILMEGDRGIVTFKGTEFVSFERER